MKGVTLSVMNTDLDVLCVCCLQFLSEVRVSLQNLNHLPEVPVVVQAGVLQERHKGQDVHNKLNLLTFILQVTEDRYHALLLYFFFNFLVDPIAINRH